MGARASAMISATKSIKLVLGLVRGPQGKDRRSTTKIKILTSDRDSNFNYLNWRNKNPAIHVYRFTCMCIILF